jgi:hypothetical protein
MHKYEDKRTCMSDYTTIQKSVYSTDVQENQMSEIDMK